MESRTLKPSILWIIALILGAALVGSRLFPYAPNFGLVTALVLFSAAFFGRQAVILGVLFASLLLTDFILGWRFELIGVYCSYFAIFLLAQRALRRPRPLLVVATSISSSWIFFVLSNFGIWALTPYYAKSWEGFVHCYIMALPFFRASLASDLLFSLALFGLASMMMKFSVGRFWSSPALERMRP